MPTPIKDHPTAAKLLAIRDELATELLERNHELTAVIVALLARRNVMLIGRPGIAKTLLIELVCQRIDDAIYKAVLLGKKTPPEALFGPLDVTKFAEGRMTRRTRGFLPEAHIALLDEIGKSNDAVLNDLLTLINEGQFDDDGERRDAPLFFTGAATNEFLPDELAAFNDRFLVKLMVEPIQQDSNFIALVSGATTVVDEPTTVTLDELEEAYELIQRVHIPRDTLDRLVKMRQRLRAEAHCDPSPRRWKWAVEFLRAFAFLHGRDTVSDEDLTCLTDVLWEVPEHRREVQDIILSCSSEMAQAAVKWSRQLGELASEMRDLEGKSNEERSARGSDINLKLSTITTDLTKMTEDCRRQGIPTHRLEDVGRRLVDVRAKAYELLVGMTPDRARAMAESSL